MKVTLERPIAEVDHHEAAGDEPPPELAGLPRSRRIPLACWIGTDAALIIGLAVRNATLTSTAWDLIGTALLSGIGITCALAVVQLAKGSRAAALTAMLSQIFVAGLAVYVWMVDERSPARQLLGVTGVALTLGGIGLLWVLYLGRYARGAFSKGAAVVVALFPMVGLGQFWMQTEYLPASASPLVDISTELSPIGSSGSVVHLLAKLTLHNRGSVGAELHVGLMRVTSYPVGTPADPPTADTLLAGLTPLGRSLGGHYRETPTLAADARLLYADLFAAPYDDAVLAPGETAGWQRVIDIDARTVRLVRLSVEAIVATHRMMQDVHTCYPPRVSVWRDPLAFFDEAGKLHDWKGGAAHVLCAESQFASIGAIQDLVSDHPVLRSFIVVDTPSPVTELPTLMTTFGTRATIEDEFTHLDTANQIVKANPSVLVRDSAEYAPSDGDLRPGGGG
ncbi:hypothetical protein C1Y40_04596 [Mycobacterium talmoniae]|uniref:Uncharacterized protein n=1 Tax=Mycobacterium talmoniae TaxID=1858794 RepID=A0A1S1NFY6_9MYCO|nr:hypothetical protein BKN37_15565 [Mycobacterium talmoniae]PQM45237.1 hypothetical protein C1Y40_04596 [Mycobacterium talmoniae]